MQVVRYTIRDPLRVSTVRYTLQDYGQGAPGSIPAGALVDRDGNPILDRDGNYIIVGR